MRYFAERLLSTIPVLLGVSLLVFLLVHAIPGDPARNIAGERASAEVLDKLVPPAPTGAMAPRLAAE